MMNSQTAKIASLGILTLILPLVSTDAEAQFVQSVGAGTAVTVADYTATFDTIVENQSLVNYMEGGLTVSTPGVAYIAFDPTAGSGVSGFSGSFFYPSSGANGAISIKATDGTKLQGVEFNLGTGYFVHPLNDFAYFAYDNGVQIASGSSNELSGSVIGFYDANGFDTLYIGSYVNAADAQSATISSFQAGAIDNLRVSAYAPNSTVPEPGAMALIVGSSVTGACFCLRRKRISRR